MPKFCLYEKLVKDALFVSASLPAEFDPYKRSDNLVYQKVYMAVVKPFNMNGHQLHDDMGRKIVMYAFNEKARVFQVKQKTLKEIKPTDYFVFIPTHPSPVEIRLETLWVKQRDNTAAHLNHLDLGPRIEQFTGEESVIDLGGIYKLETALAINRLSLSSDSE